MSRQPDPISMTTFGREVRGKHVFDMQGVKRVLEPFQRRVIDVLVVTKREDGAVQQG